MNVQEGANLWEILADRTQSEDESVWERYIPEFSRIILEWQALGFLKVFRSVEWPAHDCGTEISGEQLETLLNDHASWEYSDHPSVYVAVAPGGLDFIEVVG
ncbi:hypothetical protein [Streptomyces sp. NPDC002394]